MPISVLFFGSTAEIAGQRQIEVQLLDKLTAGDVFEQLLADFPRLAARQLRYSVNHQYARGDEIIRDGDELAIFTAVSGG
ncbi:MAG: MoaD/ThiS family protein [Pyrinomonadaceae bacterium]